MTKDIKIGKLLLQFGWAETGTWETSDSDGITHLYLFSCHLVKYQMFRSLFFVLGPVYIAVSHAHEFKSV